MIGRRLKVGPKGQVVIPKLIRDSLKMHPGSEVDLVAENDRIIIQPPRNDYVGILRRIAAKGKPTSRFDADAEYAEAIERRFRGHIRPRRPK